MDTKLLSKDKTHRTIAVLLTTLLCSIGAIVFPSGNANASAADWWDPSLIITDEVFTNSNSMSENDIKNFILDKGNACSSSASATCLKDLKVNARAVAPEASRASQCSALPVANNISSWTAIYRVSQACGINPQVLLVNLQKESSGLTQAKNTAAWNKVMGAACPESGCDPNYAGFDLQVYRSAEFLMGYFNNPSKWPRVAAAVSGTSITLPNGYVSSTKKTCGSSTIKVRSKATGALYTYTPYTPNTQTVQAFPNVPNSSSTTCVHRGWLTFGNYMKTWFPTSYDVRIYGPTRIETAVQVSKEAYSQASVVYIGRQDILTDAQTASTLKDGPVLLTYSRGTVPNVVLNQISSLGISEIVILGGTQAISDDVLNQLQRHTGIKPTRLAGNTRSETARQIADRWVRINGTPTQIYISNAGTTEGSIDAAVAGSLTQGPILTLEGTNPVSIEANRNWINNNAASAATYAIGGQGVLTDASMYAMKNNWDRNLRLGGSDRYQTSVKIATHAINTGSDPSMLYVATGKNLADSAVAGVLPGTLVLVGTSLPPSVSDFVIARSPSSLTAIGGTQAVSTAILSSIAAKAGLI